MQYIYLILYIMATGWLMAIYPWLCIFIFPTFTVVLLWRFTHLCIINPTNSVSEIDDSEVDIKP